MNSKNSISCALQRLGLSAIAICVAFCSSCSTPEDPLLDVLNTQLANIKIDNLSRTMNFVSSPVRYQKTQFEERLAASLNRWSKSESELMARDQWSLDEMSKEVLDQYSDLPITGQTDGLGFVNSDSYNIQQNFWAKEVAQRMAANKELGPFEIYRIASEFGETEEVEDEEADPLGIVLQKLHKNMSIQDSEGLAKAVRVFDFVIRNIHLLPDDLLTAGLENPNEISLNEADSPAAAGIPGLGYTRFPWQTLLFSRGDYVERAKLFMVLLNQLDLDSVMLTTEIDDDVKPWAVGVNVGKKIYVFDTRLGLPIPVGETGQIATLSDLRSNPEILEQLDLTIKESLKDETDYWVKAEQLKEINALIYLPPESASYRYFELESKLIGETRMNLVILPTEIIAEMPELSGVKYGVWDISFKTHQFRRAVRDAIAEASFNDSVRDKLRWYYSDEMYVNEFVRYRTARSKYFKGIYETIRNDGNLNAIELFYSMIYKDSKIQSLATDKVFQIQLAVTQGSKQTVSDFEKMISGVQSNMRLVRRDSGFFLSLCHFDLGNYSTATNWLTRLEEIEDTARWQAAINYLRGRALEAQRDYDSAVDALNNEDSEQFHGNLIRVRLLKKITGATGNQGQDKKGEAEPNPPKAEEAEEKNGGGVEDPAEQTALEPESDSPKPEDASENSDGSSAEN